MSPGRKPLSLYSSLFKLLRADLADISEHVRERGAERIKPLRLELDAQLGKFERVRFDPCDVLHGRHFP